MITTRSGQVEKILEKSRWIKKRKWNGPVSPLVIKTIKEKAAIKAEKRKEDKEIIAAWTEIKAKSGIESRDRPEQEYYTHQKLLERYPNKTWTGNRCFIIGGGPSLKGFDFSKLKGELTIAINRAFEFIEPSIIFFTDNETFYQEVIQGEFGKEAKNKFINSNSLKIALNISGYDYKYETYSLPLSRNPELTTDLRDGLFDGGNSGFAALNLAICLEANPIYLLGFDMKGDGKGNQAWFHEGYKSPGKEKTYKKFINYFEEAVPLIKRTGSRVVNLNPKSELKCFEFGEFKDINPPPGYDYHEAYDSKKVIPYKNKTAYFEGALGLGDNFYQRPVIKDLAKTYKKVYLSTAFPEIYWDIPNIEFVYPEPLNLRTQKKHVESLSKKTWSNKPTNADIINWATVGPTSLNAPYNRIQTKYVELENKEDFDFTFPVKNEWIKAAKDLVESLPLDGKKLCIVRRPTDRKEWSCPARNPKIEYYQLLIDRYGAEYFYLGIADIEEGQEWFDGNLIGMDKEFNKGEIPLTTILGLLKIADMTITYPSLFMIAAIAIRTKCFCIFGGIAGPEHILRKNLGYQNFAHVAADPFCSCHTMNHNCNKEIPVEKIIKTFEGLKNRKKIIKRVSIGTPPGMGDSYWVMTKMESFKEKNAIDHLTVIVHRDPIHYYTADYIKLLPFVDEVKGTNETLQIGQFYEDKENPGYIAKNIQGVDYLIDPGAKMWLKGIHLQDILSEYETNYQLPINLSLASREFASAIREKNKGKLVLFYTSSIGNNGNWNKDEWKYKDWMALINLIYEYSHIRPIAIGAEWDRNYINELKKLDKNNTIQDFVGGVDIQLTLSLIKEANLVISFTCGIPIFATYFGIPAVSFWAIRGISKCERFDPSFQYTWVPPEIKQNGKYIPIAYGSQEARPEWIFERTKEFL